MRRLRLLSTVCVVALASTASAADPPAAPAAAVPGVRGDLLKLLASTEKQTISLEQAMPQDKFSWRPAKGVRSVAEVYLHSAGSIYGILGAIGREPPADLKAIRQSGKWETQTTDKEAIKAALSRAFAFLRESLTQANDADLDKTLQFFGSESTQRGVYLLVYGHCQEHLGQAIAYARTNGVAPPWSKKE